MHVLDVWPSLAGMRNRRISGWQQKLTEWGTTLLPLAAVLSAHPTPPDRDMSSLLETYPTKEEITESLAEIHRLYLEIQRLDELLKEFM